jgi:hypothetical protein
MRRRRDKHHSDQYQHDSHNPERPDMFMKIKRRTPADRHIRQRRERLRKAQIRIAQHPHPIDELHKKTPDQQPKPILPHKPVNNRNRISGMRRAPILQHHRFPRKLNRRIKNDSHRQPNPNFSRSAALANKSRGGHRRIHAALFRQQTAASTFRISEFISMPPREYRPPLAASSKPPPPAPALPPSAPIP